MPVKGVFFCISEKDYVEQEQLLMRLVSYGTGMSREPDYVYKVPKEESPEELEVYFYWEDVTAETGVS